MRLSLSFDAFQLRLDEIVCLRNLRYIFDIYEVLNCELAKFFPKEEPLHD